MSNKTVVTKGLSVFTKFTVLFVGLKLTNVIDWSWWIVLAPSWIPVVLVVIISIVALLIIKNN